MHYALVFSTSNTTTGSGAAADWLRPFSDAMAGFSPQQDATWLANGAAAEIICASSSQHTVDLAQSPAFGALRKITDAAGIDVNLVPTNNRRKRLLLADMDSTIITSESLDELAELAGIGAKVTDITRRAMAGEIDFEAALDERVAMLAGKPTALLDRMVAASQLTRGAITLVRTMRAQGAFCYLVSGGFDVLTKPIAATCGFHGHHANHLHLDANCLTGTVQKPVLDRHAKIDYLNHYCALHGLDVQDSAAIGDGANDLGMLQTAGFGVAFDGKPILRQNINLQLNHTDLSGLLFLQGIHQDEFAA